VTTPNNPKRLRILLPTALAPNRIGWHLGIRSLVRSLENCGAPIDVKIIHVKGDARLNTKADIILFSFSNPLDFRVLFDFCRLAGLPPRAAARADQGPVFIGGGIGLANPEPLGDYLDAVILGLDHQPVLQLLRTLPARPHSRQSVLATLTRTPNAYVPSAIDVAFAASGELCRLAPRYGFAVRKTVGSVARAIGGQVSPEEGVLMPDIGCRQRCSFCVIPFLYPYQEAPLADLSAQVDDLRSSGVVNIKINSATAPQHSEFDGILARLKELNLKVALGSMRVDQVTPMFVRELTSSHRISASQHLYSPAPPNGAASLTFGVETASTRLLRLLNKKLTGIEIANRLKALIDAGLRNVGIYLLAGIPTETRDDVLETAVLIADLARRLRGINGHVYVGVNPLIPTPHTPMQRTSIMSCAELSDWRDALSVAVSSILDDAESFARVHLTTMSSASFLIETLAMRGDRRIGSVLETLHSSTSWDRIDEDLVENELARHALPPLSFQRRRIPQSALLPWSLVMSPTLGAEELAYYQRERAATTCLPRR